MKKVVDFLGEVRVELSKVVWPTRQQTIQLTLIVVLVTLIVGFFLGLFDLGLAKILDLLLKK